MPAMLLHGVRERHRAQGAPTQRVLLWEGLQPRHESATSVGAEAPPTRIQALPARLNPLVTRLISARLVRPLQTFSRADWRRSRIPARWAAMCRAYAVSACR